VLAVRFFATSFLLSRLITLCLPFLKKRRYLSRIRTEAKARNVKVTARIALRTVNGTFSWTRRGSSHANMAMKCRLQIEQKPKVKLPNMVQTKIPEKYREDRA